MNDDCIFCRIARGEIPSTPVYRSERVLAIEDLAPQAPHHVLVLPVDHYADVAALVGARRPELLCELFETAARIGRERGGADGFRLVVNSGPRGGQTVDHLHVHVLAGRQMTWPPG